MNPYLKNIIIFFIAIIVLVLLFANDSYTDSGQLKDKNLIKLNPQMSEFLKNESIYKRDFSKGKNIVFYGEECSCPYSQRFTAELNRLVATGKYKKHYKFVVMTNDRRIISMKDKDYENFLRLEKSNPEQFNQLLNSMNASKEDILPESKWKWMKEFYDKIGVFGIVNSSATKMVKFSGVGNKEIEHLEEILDKYNNLDW